jgi:hypothetical protein
MVAQVAGALTLNGFELGGYMRKTARYSAEALIKAVLANPSMANYQEYLFTGAELLRRKRIHVVLTNQRDRSGCE